MKELSVGFADGLITPVLNGTFLDGYGFRETPADSIRDELHAKVMAAGDGIEVVDLETEEAIPEEVLLAEEPAEELTAEPVEEPPAELPEEPAELLARVENVLKRTQPESAVYERGDLRVNFETREVWRNGIPVSLTTLEFNLLKTLIDAGRTAMSREELLGAVWGYHYTGETRTVDVHVQRLRGKIGADRIETIIRYGYRFREDV